MPATVSRPRAPRRRKVEQGLYITGDVYSTCATPPGSRRAKWKTLGVMGIMEARRLRDDWRVEVRAGRFTPLISGMDLEPIALDFLRDCETRVIKGSMARNTATTYGSSLRYHVIPYFKDVPIEAVEPDHIVQWLDELRENVTDSRWSVYAYWNAAKRAFGWAARRNLIDKSPCDALMPHERPSRGRARMRILADREVEALFDAATSLRAKAILGLIIFCGLRASEVLGLIWDDFDFDGGFVHVNRQMSREGSERIPLKGDQDGTVERFVVLIPELAEVLQALRAESRFSALADLVFANSKNRTISYWNLLDIWTEAKNAAGLSRDATPHSGRHTFASKLIASGANPEWVQNQLGHARLSTTLDIYVHLFDMREHAEKSRAAMSAAYGGMLSRA